jgi:methyl-accepting chemotaxis protein
MNVLHHLRLWQKFALLGALSVMIALPLGGVLIRDRWITMQVASEESEGIKPAGDVLKLMRLTQQHRGLSAAVLNGDASLADARKVKASEVAAALEQALAQAARYSDPAQLARRQAAQKAWQGLPEAVESGSLTAPQSFQKHTTLIRLELEMLEDITDASGMALDPEAATYYLMQSAFANLPPVTEFLGQLRARGAAALARADLSPAERSWIGLRKEQMADAFDQFKRNADKSFAADPEFATSMADSMSKAQAAIASATRLLDEQIIKPDKPVGVASEFFKEITQAIDAQFDVAAASYSLLQSKLDARVEQSRRTMLLAALGTAAAVIFSIALAVSLTRSAMRSVSAAKRAASALAAGDLTQRMSVDAHDEIGQMVVSLDGAVGSLSRTLSQVLSGVDSVATASAQIAQGTSDLAARTEQQASSLEQTAASMQQMTRTVASTSDSAREANQLALGASQVATKGGEVVAQVVSTMQEITEASRKIADIISVIDGIAFQTNILALNAAVEAARAGEQGRGFAVVASEVRSLAQRSAEAAREIKGLIGSSVSKVEAGASLVNEAGQTMNDIVSQVRRVTDLIGEITAAAGEQNTGIREVNAAVDLLSRGTQQNAAMVEQSMAAADSLRQQAAQMAQAASVFKISQA